MGDTLREQMARTVVVTVFGEGRKKRCLSSTHSPLLPFNARQLHFHPSSNSFAPETWLAHTTAHIVIDRK